MARCNLSAQLPFACVFPLGWVRLLLALDKGSALRKRIDSQGGPPQAHVKVVCAFRTAVAIEIFTFSIFGNGGGGSVLALATQLLKAIFARSQPVCKITDHSAGTSINAATSPHPSHTLHVNNLRLVIPLALRDAATSQVAS